MSQILGAIKVIVVIVHVFLICLPYPITAQIFFGGLMQVITFQFYNFTNFYTSAFNLDDNGNNPLANNFNTSGYGALYLI